MPDNLIQQLDTTRTETETVLQSLDPSTVIYTDWTIKDIIGHLTAWEQATITSLQAHAEGGESCLPPNLSENDYNHLNVARRKHFSLEKILQEWADTREWLKQALEELPAPQLEKPMLYPWGERGSVANLIQEMIDHEIEHRNDILNSL